MSDLETLESSLEHVYSIEWPEAVQQLLFGPPGDGRLTSVSDAYEIVRANSSYALMSELIPLAVIDDRSLACVVSDDVAEFELAVGDVVRWHLDDVPIAMQAELLDVDPLLYVKSVADELGSRKLGLRRMLDEIGPAYEESHLSRSKRPRDYVVRPVRIACQNVIVGLAAIAQEASFDGLAVVAWQTCEVPHVATHEANRALAALTLCDTFQNGGTMEIRFDRQARVTVGGKSKTYEGHPERRVPASLRRFGRTVGVELGADDPAAITPAEARDLFMAITPMPGELRDRVNEATETLGLPPERVCFALLSQVWRPIELDFILATTPRAASILEGGAAWTHRADRQAESDVCRAAIMIGMLHQRLDSSDSAGASGEARVVEDRHQGVAWQVDHVSGSVQLSGIDRDDPLPWTQGVSGIDSLRVFPRSAPSPELFDQLIAMAAHERVALLVPRDAAHISAPEPVIVLRGPDRFADIDKAIEAKLLTSRISRG